MESIIVWAHSLVTAIMMEFVVWPAKNLAVQNGCSEKYSSTNVRRRKIFSSPPQHQPQIKIRTKMVGLSTLFAMNDTPLSLHLYWYTSLKAFMLFCDALQIGCKHCFLCIDKEYERAMSRRKLLRTSVEDNSWANVTMQIVATVLNHQITLGTTFKLRKIKVKVYQYVVWDV